MKKKIRRNLLFLILLAANLLLYLPSLFEPLSYGDECVYLTLGSALKKGLVFYRDIHDNKPPLLYFLAAVAGRLSFFHFLTILANLTHLFLIFKLAEKLTKSKKIAFVSAIFFTVFLLIFEGRVTNGEIFMMLPVTAAVYLLLTKPNKQKFSFGAVIGLLFSLGFLFKIPVAFDFIGIILAFFLLPVVKFNKKIFLKVIKDKKLLGIISGFAAPIILSIIYYATKGAFTPYVRSALLQNIGYLSSWGNKSLGLLPRFTLLVLFSGLLLVFRKKFSFDSAFFTLWFFFALFGSLLSGRPYPHYLIEIIPSLSLLTAVTLKKIKSKEIGLLFFCYFILFTSYFLLNFWRYPILPYYKNFASYAFGGINQQQYFSFFGGKTLNDYKISEFIKEHSLLNERIFVWGDGACIYALSNRLPPGRYMVNYHIFDFNGFDETMTAINKTRPRVIIKLKEEKRVWPQLNETLSQYHLLSFPGISDEIYVRNGVLLK